MTFFLSKQIVSKQISSTDTKHSSGSPSTLREMIADFKVNILKGVEASFDEEVQPVLEVRIADDKRAKIVECMFYIQNLHNNEKWKSLSSSLGSALLTYPEQMPALIDEVRKLMNGVGQPTIKSNLSIELAKRYKERCNQDRELFHRIYWRYNSLCLSDLKKEEQLNRRFIIDELDSVSFWTKTIKAELDKNPHEVSSVELNKFIKIVEERLRQAEKYLKDHYKFFDIYVNCLIKEPPK